jgi:threonine/homoserine/homoserine lactone efflux protein
MGAAEAFLFGVTVAAAVGPIAILIVNNGMRFGAWVGMRSGLGAAVCDLIFALIALLAGSVVLPVLEAYRGAFKLLAALVLIVLGLNMAWSALRARGPVRDLAPEHKPQRPFLTVLALTFVNPLTIILFASFAAQVEGALTPARVGALTAALFLGSLSGQMVFALGGAVLGRLVQNPHFVRAINLASAAGITAFGVVGMIVG